MLLDLLASTSSAHRVARLLALSSGIVVAAAALADPGWHQFRGPERDGTIDAAVRAESWAESPPRELWRRPIGGGFSALLTPQ